MGAIGRCQKSRGTKTRLESNQPPRVPWARPPLPYSTPYFPGRGAEGDRRLFLGRLGREWAFLLLPLLFLLPGLTQPPPRDPFLAHPAPNTPGIWGAEALGVDDTVFPLFPPVRKGAGVGGAAITAATDPIMAMRSDILLGVCVWGGGGLSGT